MSHAACPNIPARNRPITVADRDEDNLRRSTGRRRSACKRPPAPLCSRRNARSEGLSFQRGDDSRAGPMVGSVVVPLMCFPARPHSSSVRTSQHSSFSLVQLSSRFRSSRAGRSSTRAALATARVRSQGCAPTPRSPRTRIHLSIHGPWAVAMGCGWHGGPPPARSTRATRGRRAEPSGLLGLERLRS
jgi:hypothetical protein